MSVESVRFALRSTAPLVVIEAPAGCGKTHQGADYAREVAAAEGSGRPLILTHTHAACSVFAERTSNKRSRVDIRTIDSVIGQIAAAYHAGLGLPADTAAWLRQEGDTGHQQLAMKVARLLNRYPMIAATLARRYPVVICDEHQDSSGDQHATIMAVFQQGARLRVFGDPMQKIFKEKTLEGSCLPYDWDSLAGSAHHFEKLNYPHRWDTGCSQLGEWTLKARETLRSGGRIDLRNALPPSVRVIYAENNALANLDYQLQQKDRKAIDAFEQAQDSLLVLTRHNKTALSIRAFFNRRILLWEGHTRPGLDRLVEAVCGASGDRVALASAVVRFMSEIGKGFSPSAFGDAFEQEVRDGCKKVRKGKRALIQSLARCLIEDPTHHGVSRTLQRLLDLKESESAFADVQIDCKVEMREAIRLGAFDTPQAGLAEVTHRRTYMRPKPPSRAISIVHKAKGLECDSVLLMPCDSKTFPAKDDARCLLYVALSRARKKLMLVVSREDASPLFII